jgi:uncharacterized protein
MTTSKHQEEMLDQALEETFPASDVPRVYQRPPSPPAPETGHEARHPVGSVVDHEERGTRGEFFLAKDGTRAGRLTYRRQAPDTVILIHTEVGEALRGQGAGKRLVEAAVLWARAEHLRLVPHCPFARATFEKHPELQDVLAH